MMDKVVGSNTGMPQCPICQRRERQVKAGTHAGAQRYKCLDCERRYTLEDRRQYPEAMREEARRLHGEGNTIRQVARRLDVSTQTVANWLQRQERPVSVVAPAPTAPTAVPPEIRPTGEPRRATIKEVARYAGVSTSTISNYLNGRQRMGEDTRTRIEAAIDRLHFTPSALVRAIRHRRTGILGVLLWGLNDLERHVNLSLTPPLLAGFSSAADAAGYNLLLYTGFPHRLPDRPGSQFLDGHIDGLLWVAPEMDEPALTRVAQAGLPVIAVLTRQVPDRVGYVQTDNIAAMESIINHLVERGHRRIAYTGPLSTSDFQDRRDGYRAALTRVGIPWDARLEVTFESGEWKEEIYRTVVARWRKLTAPPTTIVLPSDGFAGQMVELVRAQGLRVPEDIAITGFDDIPAAEQLGGGLTTIHQPLREIGEHAVMSLLALIEGASAQDCRLQLPASLVLRSSTIRRG